MMIARLVLAAATAMLIASAPSTSAQELKKWRHGVVDPKGDAGFTFMVGRNEFAAKQGLKIEVLALRDGALAHKALLAGEVDSIWSSPGQAIIAGARGADVRILGCDWPSLTHGLMVRSPIASPQDLKGKTVAVATPGSLPNLVLGGILDKYQVPRSEVRQAPLGGDPDRFKALVAGIVDAGIVVGEFLPLAPANITMLIPGREALPNYVRSCFTTTGQTLAGRRDEAIRFLAATIDALRYALAHRAETIKLTQDIIGVPADDPRAPYVFDDTVKNGLLDPSLPLPMNKFSWMQGEFVTAGNLPTVTDLAKVVNPEIRIQAMARLGK